MALSQSAAGRAVFITLEGPDGAGKSSQAASISRRLGEAGVEVLLTREPGGTELGEQIRGLLLGRDRPDRDPLTDALLFNAARRALVEQVIRPALASGHWVICDRYADSTLAYQGYGAAVPLSELRALAQVSTGGLAPELTLLFDLPVEIGLARRAGGRAAELTRFELAERHDFAFHQRVRAGFLELAAAEPARWRVIDASAPPAAVGEQAWLAVEELLVTAHGGA